MKKKYILSDEQKDYCQKIADANIEYVRKIREIQRNLRTTDSFSFSLDKNGKIKDIYYFDLLTREENTLIEIENKALINELLTNNKL